MSLASGGRALRRHPRRPRNLLRQDVGQNHLEHIAHRTRVAHADAARQLVAEAFGDVGRVGRRQDHGRQPRPARPQHLLPDAADRLDRSPRASAPRSWPRPPAPAVRSAPRPGRRPAPPPADGPSFHRAASARCTCTSVVPSNLAAPARRSACERTHVIVDVRRLPRHRPHRPGDAQRPAAGKPRRLDEQYVAALAGCGQAQGDAGTADLGRRSPRRGTLGAPSHADTASGPISPGQRKTLGPQARCSAAEPVDARRRGRAGGARRRWPARPWRPPGRAEGPPTTPRRPTPPDAAACRLRRPAPPRRPRAPATPAPPGPRPAGPPRAAAVTPFAVAALTSAPRAASPAAAGPLWPAAA